MCCLIFYAFECIELYIGYHDAFKVETRFNMNLVIISVIVTERAVILLLRLMEYFSQFYFGNVCSALSIS